ncbi:predicted protein [Naegleria gruberi]|uniref:Predicted protein n=1 Tax=Naegleria gruberi TaxID=5762 RepID=D2W046_NAEGR|nr:uncharacterized protein NAEGRDRAFT_59735 [Naegleria gruberi]EFC37550.1 predicted protein [Naegleria gruberi]|eukprot:XP_002670294.1 predicted protein [Naegleria gruberi strain NEG-M]
MFSFKPPSSLLHQISLNAQRKHQAKLIPIIQQYQERAFAKLRYSSDHSIINTSNTIRYLKPSIGKLVVEQYLPKDLVKQQGDEVIDYKGFKIPKRYIEGDLSSIDFSFLAIYTKYKIDSVNDLIGLLREIVEGSNSGNIKKEEFASICLNILELISMNIYELENSAKQDYTLKFNKIVSLLNVHLLPELVIKIKERIEGLDTKDTKNINFLLSRCDWFQFSKKSWFWSALERAEEEFRTEFVRFQLENMKPISIPNNYIGTLITNGEVEMLQQAHVLHERHGNLYFDLSKGLFDENMEVRRISYSIQMTSLSSGIEKKVESLLASQKALAKECKYDNFYDLMNRNDVSDFRIVLNDSLLELQRELGDSNLSVSDLPYLRKTFLDDPIRKLSTTETMDGLRNIFKDLFKIDLKFFEIRAQLYNIEIRSKNADLISSGRLDLNTMTYSKVFAEDRTYFCLQFAKGSEDFAKFSIKESFQLDTMSIENVVDLFIQLTKAIRYHIDDDSFSEIEFNKEEMFVIDKIMEMTIRNEKVFLKYFYKEPSDQDSIKKLYHDRSQRLATIQNIEDQEKIMSQLNAYSYFLEEEFKETEATKMCRDSVFRNIKEQLYRIPSLTITGRNDHLLNQHFLKKQAKDIWNLYFSQDPLDSSKMLELFCSTPELKDEPHKRSKRSKAIFFYTLLFIIFSIIGYILE